MRWIGALVALLAITSAQANIIENIVGQITGIFQTYEEAPYDVVRTAPGYEERRYPARKWVCTATQGNTAAVMEPMFWRLFQYIAGDNSEHTKIAMTVPVTTEFQVVGPTNKKYTMCFYIGQHHQANAPAPTNSEVFIQNRPQMNILTRTVGGYIETETQWLDEAGRLAAIMEENGETVTLEHLYWVGYDPPLKFWNRRNEVWFPKK